MFSYFFDAELLWRGQSTPSNKEDAKNNKRKSAPPVVDTKESPQKSAVFHVAGTSEDDWMPESVAETTNSMVKMGCCINFYSVVLGAQTSKINRR